MTKKEMGLRTKRKSGKRRRRKRRKKKRKEKGKGKKIKKEMKKRKTKGRKRNAVKNWNRTLLWHKESLIGIGDRDHLGIGTSEIEMNVVMVIVKGKQVFFLKFIYSEKATKFCEISILLLSYVVPVKNKVEISQNFVAFSEYMNFTKMESKSWKLKSLACDWLVVLSI